MPGWLIGFLINLALKLGLPWLIKKFPWIPPDVIEIVEKLVGELDGKREAMVQLKSEKKDAVRTARKRIKRALKASREGAASDQ